MKSLEQYEEKYKKDLEFIEIVLNDSLAWMEYYDREIDRIQEKIDSKIGYVDEYMNYESGDIKMCETKRIELEAEIEEARELTQEVGYLIDQKFYWKKISEKWKKELEIETQKQKIA